MSSIKEFWQQAAGELARGRSLCLATIVRQSGSAPRPLGTVFAVDRWGGINGSIGGGRLEAEVMAAAARVLDRGRTAFMDFSLTGREAAELEMICGGTVQVFLEPLASDDPAALALAQTLAQDDGQSQGLLWTRLDPDARGAVAGRKGLWRRGQGPQAGLPGAAWEPVLSLALDQGSAGIFQVDGQPDVLFLQPLAGQPVVYLCGGGHISLYLAPLVKLVGFGLVVVEDRPEFCNPQRFPQADRLLVRPPQETLDGLELGPQAYVVIVTRGHLNDKEVLAQALVRPSAYLGMIGSRRKRALIYQALLDEGFSRADLERVHAPIGLDIGADTPAEIAISIAAELIAVRAGLKQAGGFLAQQTPLWERKTCPAG